MPITALLKQPMEAQPAINVGKSRHIYSYKQSVSVSYDRFTVVSHVCGHLWEIENVAT